MDTSCCSLSVKVVFQNSSRLGNRPRCKVPFNQDIAFPSFTAISSDKASFLPNAQYQSLACAASLLTIQTQQENTFARASYVFSFVRLGKDLHRSLPGWSGQCIPVATGLRLQAAVQGGPRTDCNWRFGPSWYRFQLVTGGALFC